MFSLVCLILSIVLYSVFMGLVYTNYHPYCISNSYYVIKNQNLFTYWIILVAFLIFPSWVEITPIVYQFLPFLSVVGLCLVGIFPKFLESDRPIHIMGAVLACVISIIWNIVTQTYIIPLLLLLVLIILCALSIPNKLFWIENLAFMNIYLSILFN